MLDENGRRWTRKVRAGVKPFSRDGARVAFKALEGIAEVEHTRAKLLRNATRTGTLGESLLRIHH